MAKFTEFFKGEVRRIPIPRTRVNKSIKKSREGSPRPFSLRANYFASYGPTRLAVARSSNPDDTASEGLVPTCVNLLPSGATNRSNRGAPGPAKVTVPVQSALTVYVPEACTLRTTCPLKLTEATESILPLPSKTS